MKTRQPLLLRASLSLALLLLLLFVPPRLSANAQAQSAVWCQCVGYVVNRLGLNLGLGPGFVGAADMGPALEANGFGQVAEPVVNAVIVFPRWFGAGIDTTYGHVGMVTQVRAVGSGTWSLTVRGARQNGSEQAEYGCSNVSDMVVIIGSGSGATLYAHPTSAAPVVAGPGRLRVVEPLKLSSTAPRTGDFVHARFAVQNVGGQPLVVETLTVGGRQGSSWDALMLADFPYQPQIVIEPGQVYTYQGTRTFNNAGDYFAEPIAQIGGGWSQIEQANQVRYHINAAAPVIVVAPAAPTANQPLPTVPQIR